MLAGKARQAIGADGGAELSGRIWPEKRFRQDRSAALEKVMRMDGALRELLRRLRSKGISDPRVLGAMAGTPREAFVSGACQKARAYADEALPIECAQTISQPFVVAYMTERLQVSGDGDVLEIGTGSGYQAAILARLARHVYTIEQHPELHHLAASRFARFGLDNVTAIAGDGTKGWPEPRAFYRIIVTAAALEPPAALLDQLGPCGFMVIPLGPPGGQRITLITRGDGRLEYQTLLPVRFVPLLPATPDGQSG
jgi:protein-L-isoaspartate(D-aspartate) O-methyltransferase